jgi:two-component system repressor protein LuxO
MQKPDEQTILLVEDALPLARIYEECLRQEGYSVIAEQSAAKATEFLDHFMPAAMVLDLVLPDANGLDILKQAHKLYPALPVVVVTANNSVGVAVEAMRNGAFDFIVKPFPAARLTTTIKNALERQALIAEVTELWQVLGQDQFYDFIGQSSAMQAVYRIIDSVAASKANVFIKGESGTGKELAAQAIHKASHRRLKPFVALNCAAIPHDLLESHIFGHIKGAFTGATDHRIGAAKAAQGGTLFLDEICEIPPELQAKLLRFMQTGEITPVGSVHGEIVNVRIVAATNRDPLNEIAVGRFREDLYYRLNVIPVELPPLRDREDDVIILAHHFLDKFSAEEGKRFKILATEVIALFRRYDWPGNVRQLENVIRNVVVLNNGEIVTRPMLPEDLQRFAETSIMPANENAEDVMLAEPPARDAIKPLWLTEKETIMKALSITHQDITQAAAMLEISLSTLYRKLQSWRSEGAVA